MAIGFLLGAALLFASYWVAGQGVGAHQEDESGDLYRGAMVSGYAIRLMASVLIPLVPLFSHGLGNRGDAQVYGLAAESIAQLWYIDGIMWVDTEMLGIPTANNALLAIHIYALLTFLNDGVLPLVACVAVNAFLAVATCHLMCLLGTMIGGRLRDCRLVATVMFYSPAFVYHTSELYKDGVVSFLVMAAVFLSFRLAERFNVRDLILAAICIYGLWWVRFYLVFLVSAPFVMSLLGLRAVDSLRVGIAVVVIAAAGLVFLSTDLGADSIELGIDTYEHATNESVLAYNAAGGSGVLFEGPPYVTFPLKILYTLLSPFPWDFRTSSIAFQIGKLDSIIWCYFLYQGVRGARRMWNDDRGTLLMFLVVLLPLTFAYASSFSNIGLIVRQRIPIVLLGSVLAVRAWSPRRAGAEDAEPEEGVLVSATNSGTAGEPAEIQSPGSLGPIRRPVLRPIRRPVLRPRTH